MSNLSQEQKDLLSALEKLAITTPEQLEQMVTKETMVKEEKSTVTGG